MKKKSTDRIAIGPKITPQCQELLLSIWDRPGTGASYILDAFPGLYRRTLEEIKGVFTREELMLMIDCMNGTLLTGWIAGDHVNANAVDGIAMDRLDEKWEVDREAFTEKFKSTTIFQRACLELWIQAFWRKYREFNIEEYVETLT